MPMRHVPEAVSMSGTRLKRSGLTPRKTVERDEEIRNGASTPRKRFNLTRLRLATSAGNCNREGREPHADNCFAQLRKAQAC